MTHVGILAHSPDGSALCYLEFIRLGHRRFGGYGNAVVTMDYVPLGLSMSAWETSDYANVRATLAASVERLKRAGCDFFLCPDNTAHIALETGVADLALPAFTLPRYWPKRRRRGGSGKSRSWARASPWRDVSIPAPCRLAESR